MQAEKIKDARQAARDEALEKLFSSIKTWGGLAGALLGLSQLVNIIINLAK
jgi:hypothetical protein